VSYLWFRPLEWRCNSGLQRQQLESYRLSHGRPERGRWHALARRASRITAIGPRAGRLAAGGAEAVRVALALAVIARMKGSRGCSCALCALTKRAAT
jgi:hypothetical protein